MCPGTLLEPPVEHLSLQCSRGSKRAHLCLTPSRTERVLVLVYSAVLSVFFLHFGIVKYRPLKELDSIGERKGFNWNWDPKALQPVGCPRESLCCGSTTRGTTWWDLPSPPVEPRKTFSPQSRGTTTVPQEVRGCNLEWSDKAKGPCVPKIFVPYHFRSQSSVKKAPSGKTAGEVPATEGTAGTALLVSGTVLPPLLYSSVIVGKAIILILLGCLVISAANSILVQSLFETGTAGDLYISEGTQTDCTSTTDLPQVSISGPSGTKVTERDSDHKRSPASANQGKTEISPESTPIKEGEKGPKQSPTTNLRVKRSTLRSDGKKAALEFEPGRHYLSRNQETISSSTRRSKGIQVGKRPKKKE